MPDDKWGERLCWNPSGAHDCRNNSNMSVTQLLLHRTRNPPHARRARRLPRRHTDTRVDHITVGACCAPHPGVWRVFCGTTLLDCRESTRMSNLYQQVGILMLAAAKVYPPGEVVPPLLGVGRDRAAGRLIPLPFPRSQPAPKWPTALQREVVHQRISTGASVSLWLLLSRTCRRRSCSGYSVHTEGRAHRRFRRKVQDSVLTVIGGTAHRRHLRTMPSPVSTATTDPRRLTDSWPRSRDS
jgi:hypothetical protein